MKGAIHVEAAVPGDARAMLRVHRAAIRTTARAFYGQAVVDAWAPLPIRPEQVARFADRIAHAEEEAVVARTPAGEVVGWGSIAPADRELRAVFVSPTQGRLGVGGTILGELEARARGHGLPELRMNASLNAEAFYRRHGFETLGDGEHVLRSGLRMPCVRMRKPLRR